MSYFIRGLPKIVSWKHFLQNKMAKSQFYFYYLISDKRVISFIFIPVQMLNGRQDNLTSTWMTFNLTWSWCLLMSTFFCYLRRQLFGHIVYKRLCICVVVGKDERMERFQCSQTLNPSNNIQFPTYVGETCSPTFESGEETFRCWQGLYLQNEV